MTDEHRRRYDDEGRSIAFVDILGFSELVKRAEDPDYFPTLLNALQTVKTAGDATFAVQQGIPPEEMQKAMDFRSHAFSDCIVLSERGKMVAPLIVAVARLAMALLKEGILIRGGIAVGKLHHDDAVVFGQAMLDAYDLERRAAKYPRVLVSDAALAVAGENAITFGGYAATHRASAFVVQDSDGLHFVDFLKIAVAAPEAVAGVAGRQLSSRIIPALTRAQAQRDDKAFPQYVRANFGWLAHYIETFLAEHRELDITVG